MFRGFSSSIFMKIQMISNSRSEHAPSSGLIKGHQASQQVFFVPIMTVTMEIELQVPLTPQLVKRGVDLTYTGLMEAGMIAGFLWFQGTFAQFWYYTSLGKGEYSARLFRSEVGRSFFKKNKKKTGETAILIRAVYEMIDRRAISPVTSLEVYSYSLFLWIS